MTNRSYLWINIISAVAILVIFLYSLIFPVGYNDYPVVCIHRSHTGVKCPSCGLSHSFSALMHGDFQSANEYNPNGLLVFLFFLIQLLLRISFSFVLIRNIFPYRKTATIDSAITVFLFIIFFGRLIISSVQFQCRLVFLTNYIIDKE
jgi:hypothetical protein